MKSHLLSKCQLIVGTSLALFLFGCGGGTQTEQPITSTSGGTQSTAPSGQAAGKLNVALVRFENASLALPVVDLYLDGNKAFNNVAYKAPVSPYTELNTNNQDFRLTAANQTAAVATLNQGLNAGQNYTMVAFPKKDGTTQLHAFNDDLNAPSNGKAKIRIINVASASDNIDVYQAGNTHALFSGLNFDSASDYNEIAPGPGTLEIRKGNAKANALVIPNVQASAGSLTTVIIMNGKSAGTLDYVMVQDQPSAGVAPTTGTTGTTTTPAT